MADTLRLPLFLTSAQVAAMLGLDDAAAFLRQRARLEDETGFPLPMPTSRRPFLWRRDQIEYWIDCQGRARPVAGMGNVVLLERARTP